MTPPAPGGPEITVCVPTYNRAACLSELLDSVAHYAPDWPLLISDNASTDATAAVVGAFARRRGRVAYHRQPANRGAIANLFAAVELAASEWVMLMGDDDALRAPLAGVVALTRRPGVDAVLLGRCDGDARLAYLRPWPYLDAAAGAGTEAGRLFARPEDLLDAGLCLGASFSFISGIVVRRPAWLAALARLKDGPAAAGFAASLFPQSWIVLDLLCRGSTVIVVDRPLVIARHGNDRLCDNNVLAHARLDVVEFDALARYLDALRPAAGRAMRALIRRHLRRHLFPRPGASLYQRGKHGDRCWRDFRAAADRYLSPGQRMLPSLVPAAVLAWACEFYRRHRRPAGGPPPIE